jgi:hypothetical protein|tara:strand:- start:811 stop:1005 length:195 start_codon:yes stop_codon:yes gene_type:complete
MMSFTDWNKKKDKNIDDYEIVKSRSGLPMFVLPNPLTQIDDEPVKKKEKTIPQMVSDFISIHNN